MPPQTHTYTHLRRVVARYADLTAAEVADLWRTVRIVQEIVLGVHRASASHLGLQDGHDAGQSVPHVHVHILPAHGGDAAQSNKGEFPVRRAGMHAGAAARPVGCQGGGGGGNGNADSEVAAESRL